MLFLRRAPAPSPLNRGDDLDTSVRHVTIPVNSHMTHTLSRSTRRPLSEGYAEGDSVTLIKDLKLKGSSTVLKRGTMIKGIHLTDNADEIEGRTHKVKGLVLRTEFLKKA